MTSSSRLNLTGLQILWHCQRIVQAVPKLATRCYSAQILSVHLSAGYYPPSKSAFNSTWLRPCQLTGLGRTCRCVCPQRTARLLSLHSVLRISPERNSEVVMQDLGIWENKSRHTLSFSHSLKIRLGRARASLHNSRTFVPLDVFPLFTSKLYFK